jgi:hypothetical protein
VSLVNVQLRRLVGALAAEPLARNDDRRAYGWKSALAGSPPSRGRDCVKPTILVPEVRGRVTLRPAFSAFFAVIGLLIGVTFLLPRSGSQWSTPLPVFGFPEPRLRAAKIVDDRVIVVELGTTEYIGSDFFCELTFNNEVRWKGDCGTQEVTIDNLSYSTNYRLQLRLTGIFGIERTSSALNVRTSDAPPPSVTVSKGAAISITGCSNNCSWISVRAVNFSPNSNVVVTCRATGEEQGFFTFSLRTNVDGSATAEDSHCSFGYSGKGVWVTVNGVESNHLIW